MNIDTNDAGERPGACPIETEHAEDCVIPLEPRGRTQDEILFHRNDGSFCLYNDLARLAEETAVEGAPCLCSRAEVAFVREATAEDHELFGWQGEKA